VNRYQREVAEMDRRHALLVRALSFSGAAVLIVAALWSAGLPPSVWWERVQAWLSAPEPARDSASLPITSDAEAVTPVASSTADQGLMPGTDSSVSDRPQTLLLIAVTPGRNKSEGTAQIGTNPDNPQTYVGGALLANGARLEEIHRDHVVLRRGDQTAKLYLFRRDSAIASTSNALLSVGGDSEAKVAAPITREILTDYLRPSPIYDGERLLGYQVYPGAKASVFARLGLQAGDVITAINGLPLSEPQQAMELFSELTRGAAVTAVIQRKSERHHLALDGALILADVEASENASAQAAAVVAPPAI
jgi:general secretion pathway protein C